MKRYSRKKRSYRKRRNFKKRSYKKYSKYDSGVESQKIHMQVTMTN